VTVTCFTECRNKTSVKFGFFFIKNRMLNLLYEKSDKRCEKAIIMFAVFSGRYEATSTPTTSTTTTTTAASWSTSATAASWSTSAVGIEAAGPVQSLTSELHKVESRVTLLFISLVYLYIISISLHIISIYLYIISIIFISLVYIFISLVLSSYH